MDTKGIEPLTSRVQSELSTSEICALRNLDPGPEGLRSLCLTHAKRALSQLSYKPSNADILLILKINFREK
jgi:hypothetical protein